MHYGGKCRYCRESRFIFLVIDHLNGGGNKHRQSIGGGSKIYRWLFSNRYPTGFQVLCYNCNAAKINLDEEKLELLFNPEFDNGAGI